MSIDIKRALGVIRLPTATIAGKREAGIDIAAMTEAQAKRALGVGQGSMADKLRTHCDPFEPTQPVEMYCSICRQPGRCGYSACQSEPVAAVDPQFRAAMSEAYGGALFAPNDVQPGPDIMAITRGMCK